MPTIYDAAKVASTGVWQASAAVWRPQLLPYHDVTPSSAGVSPRSEPKFSLTAPLYYEFPRCVMHDGLDEMMPVKFLAAAV